jgi:TonB family protein
MLRIVLLCTALTITASAQTIPTRIAPEEAANRLIVKPSPTYPPLAEQTRISGVVILQVSIDESGTPSVQRFITGHPLLAQAAIDAVRKWKYQPFEVDGKPAAVVTLVMVPFGDNKTQAANGRAVMLFQHEFWTAVDSARAALGKGDYAASEEQLNRAQALLPRESAGTVNVTERWQLLTTRGNLRMQQQKDEDAEVYFRKAQALYDHGDKDAPEFASSLADLGRLFAKEKRFDVAHEQVVRSLAIYQKNFKKAGPGNPGARQVYGQAIAYQAWMLWKLASERNDSADAVTQCRTVLEFQSFLGTADRESFVSACPQTIKSAPANPK